MGEALRLWSGDRSHDALGRISQICKWRILLANFNFWRSPDIENAGSDSNIPLLASPLRIVAVESGRDRQSGRTLRERFATILLPNWVAQGSMRRHELGQRVLL